ncbi:MAG TPA: urea ABC transporter permease subunit UrtB [Phycisphaerae bacterium]|nr:urea ABC transporter permease subunit UrtB [Phycisphaerae bacterium]
MKWRGALGVMMLCVLAGVMGRGAKGQTAAAASATAAPMKSIVVSGRNEAAAGLVEKLATTEGEDRANVLMEMAENGDPRLDQVLTDFSEGSLSVYKGAVVSTGDVVTEGGRKVMPLVDPLTRAPVMEGGKPVMASSSDLKSVDITRRERLLVRDAQMMLKLNNPDPEQREEAVVRVGDAGGASGMAALKKLDAKEKNARVKRVIAESVALIRLGTTGTDKAATESRLAGATTLGELRSLRALSRLQDTMKDEKSAEVRKAISSAIERINTWQHVVDWVGILFSGMSTSSILVLMALGLAIIFGLMGVINMAHGELMMIGAYATLLTQGFFQDHLPAGMFDWYFVAAIPFSFVCAAIVGVIMEATVIRFLYGRPLDTLLATLGISYVLIQLIRVQFGDNRAVNSPSWLTGSYEILPDINLPYNRLFIIGFCVLCIVLMYLLIEKTRMGLLLRATTQNRPMAASLGVSTRMIDMATFGLGAGLAGMAGCALTQVGGITPDMGQNYVVDSFLVVVTGGVGKLAGAIWSGLGIGMTNKFMEPFVGTVWAKVLILVLVIAFIQRRPSGLFPAKGRLADG